MKSKIIFIFLIGGMYSTSVQSQITIDTSELKSPLENVYHFQAGVYDPIAILKASNQLIDLPKQQIFDSVLQVYDTSSGYSSGFGLFLLLQLIFDIPDSIEYPKMYFGSSNIFEPAPSEIKNRFPLLIVQGFPILLPTQYIGTGLPSSLNDHIEFYSKHGIVRSQKHNLKCNCTLEELTEQLKSAWKDAYAGDMSQFNEKSYEYQLKAIASH